MPVPTSKVITGLTNGVSYLFRVAAVTTAGQGPWTTLGSAVAPAPAASSSSALSSSSSPGQSSSSADTGDPYFSNVALLIHADGDFVDYSNAARSLNTAWAQQTSDSKFGSGASYHPNGSQAIRLLGTAQPLGAGDFTMEAWVKISNLSRSYLRLFSTNASTPYCNIVLAGSGSSKFVRLDTTSGSENLGYSTWSADQWYHFAICRLNGYVRAFVNGVPLGDAPVSVSEDFTSTNFYIGGGLNNGADDDWFGAIDEIRVTVGVARYGTTNSFTPPTAAFPNFGPTAAASSSSAAPSSSSSVLSSSSAAAGGGAEPGFEYLLVAGGGGGGTPQDGGGGGGAGGLLSGAFTLTAQDVLSISVGSGGINGVNGQNSVFGAFTAIGGGYGGNNDAPSGGNGGSGGGQGRDGCGVAGTGTSGQGNSGGNTGCGGWQSGGGGGGAGEAGYDGGYDINGLSGTVSKGGDGVVSSITGTATYYAGGGGGGHNGGRSDSAAQGGLGGGGNGSNNDSTGQNGQANTGGGGGGGRNTAGGTGGSGVVIVAYPDTYPDLAVSSSLTYTQPTRAGYKVYKFTAGSGFIAFQNQTSAPNAPTNVTGIAGNSQVNLSWTAAFSAGPSVSDYLIEYSADNGSSWTTFNRSPSTATSATITGLTNDTAYIFRVAAVNSIGTGPYGTSSAITPNVFAITSQPLNDYATSGTQNVTFSVGVVGGGGPTYQWQYYGPDYNNNDYNYAWRNIAGATASSYTTNGNTIYNLIQYDFYNTASVKLRCVVTANGGSPTLTSSAVRFLQLDFLHYPSMYWYGSQGSYTNYGQPQTFTPAAGENLVVDLYDYSMAYPDTSWYTGNDTTIKIQVATTGYTDSADWTDFYTVDSRGTLYLSGYSISPSTGTKYYRIIAVNKWPYATNDGTGSATHATQYVYPRSNYDVVQVTWP